MTLVVNFIASSIVAALPLRRRERGVMTIDRPRTRRVDRRDGARPRPSSAPAPVRDGIEIGERRRCASARLDDRYALLGAAAGALALTALLFGWIAPLTACSASSSSRSSRSSRSTRCWSPRRGRAAVRDRRHDGRARELGVSCSRALLVRRGLHVLRGLGRAGRTSTSSSRTCSRRAARPARRRRHPARDRRHADQIAIALAITVPLGLVDAVFLNEVPGRFAGSCAPSSRR